MKIQEKIATLDDQIKFIRETRNFLEKHPDSDIAFGEDPHSIEILRGIEENLITTKMWVELPDYHQAALQILDAAYVLGKNADLFKDKEFTAEDYRQIIAHDIQEGRPEDVFEPVAAVALLALGKFVIPNAKVPTAPVITAAHFELRDLKAWWDRLQLDMVSDDYLEVCQTVRQKVIQLSKDNPGLLQPEDYEHFRLKAKEVSNG